MSWWLVSIQKPQGSTTSKAWFEMWHSQLLLRCLTNFIGRKIKREQGKKLFGYYILVAYKYFEEYFSCVDCLASSSLQQLTSTMYFLVLLLFYGTVQLLSLFSFSSSCCLCFAFGTFVWSWWMLHRACLCAVCPAVSFLPHNSYHKAKPCSSHFMQNQQNYPTSTELHESNRVINCHGSKNPFYFELEV